MKEHFHTNVLMPSHALEYQPLSSTDDKMS